MNEYPFFLHKEVFQILNVILYQRRNLLTKTYLSKIRLKHLDIDGRWGVIWSTFAYPEQCHAIPKYLELKETWILTREIIK